MSAIVNGLAPLARVQIPAGTFRMGSSQFREAQPITNVKISAFERSETKATVEQYDEYLSVVGKNRITLAVTDPRTGIVSIAGRERTEGSVVEACLKSLPMGEKLSSGGIVELGSLTIFEVATPNIPKEFREFPDQPVVMVNWWELAAFAAAHGGRLPTEAQCERVMRGRSGTHEYGTSTGELTTLDGTKLAHYRADKTARVKSHPANDFGAYDACGNVFDWTDTRWSGSYEGLEAQDPQGPKMGEYRVVRGGSYFINDDNLHAAYRVINSPDGRFGSVGGVVVW